MSATDAPTTYPVLPLRDIVVFPHMIVPLFVGREKSVLALEDVKEDDKQIILVSQKNPSEDDPSADDIYEVGTIGTILQLLKLPDGTVKVLVEGGARAKIVRYTDRTEFVEAEAVIITEEAYSDEDLAAEEEDALSRTAVSQFEQYIKLNKKIPPEVLVSLGKITDSSKLADTIASHLVLRIAEKQELLETFSVAARLEKVFGIMEGEIGVLQVEKRIRSRVKRQMEKTQREYYLNEQMKAIQKELGEAEESRDELLELEEQIERTKLSKEAREKAQSEMRKLRNMSPMSAEATVVRNYLDWLIGIPWKKRARIKKDINLAKEILDRDHYGLEKVKERILEYLAVQQRIGKIKGPILCLVGPPGVGKTSLGRSIAKATGRNYVRMSLGGVRDEAEIRGHRRTYIGSLPGKVVQGMKKAQTSNPLFLLDEAVRDLIRYYSREAGVRNLERELANLARKAVKEILMNGVTEVNVTPENLDKFAGVRKYRFGEVEDADMLGVVTGLAWTEVGGELLTIESVTLPGKGKVHATGKLGDVMKESVQAAESFVKSRSLSFGIQPAVFESRDIHVHVPEGATPKDGPSAGVAMVTSIVSILSGIAVRRDVAMTGEVTLRGRVLPIGGLKEKLLAALRGGIKTVLIPIDNAKDLVEIPDNVKDGLTIIPVSTVEEVLSNALVSEPLPVELDKGPVAGAIPPKPGTSDGTDNSVFTH